MAALFAAGQAVVGFCAGIAVSAGLFAFIATLGIITRLAQVTRTASAIHWYETCFIAGGIMGNLLWLYGVPVPAGAAGLLCTGLFCGIYRLPYGSDRRNTGCFSGIFQTDKFKDRDGFCDSCDGCGAFSWRAGALFWIDIGETAFAFLSVL